VLFGDRAWLVAGRALAPLRCDRLDCMHPLILDHRTRPLLRPNLLTTGAVTLLHMQSPPVQPLSCFVSTPYPTAARRLASVKRLLQVIFNRIPVRSNRNQRCASRLDGLESKSLVTWATYSRCAHCARGCPRRPSSLFACAPPPPPPRPLALCPFLACFTPYENLLRSVPQVPSCLYGHSHLISLAGRAE